MLNFLKSSQEMLTFLKALCRRIFSSSCVGHHPAHGDNRKVTELPTIEQLCIHLHSYALPRALLLVTQFVHKGIQMECVPLATSWALFSRASLTTLPSSFRPSLLAGVRGNFKIPNSAHSPKYDLFTLLLDTDVTRKGAVPALDRRSCSSKSS